MGEVDTLIGQLKDPNIQIRLNAACRLGEAAAENPESKILNALIAALKDEFAGVRIWAAMGLGGVCKQSAVPALVEALKDEDERVQKVAHEAIIGIGSIAVIELMITPNYGDARFREKTSNLVSLLLNNPDFQNCNEISELREFENRLQEIHDSLRNLGDKNTLKKIGINLTRLRTAVVNRRNKLATQTTNDIILDDKPKPPKKGMYQQIKRTTNG
jgi:hypothetical protein